MGPATLLLSPSVVSLTCTFGNSIQQFIINHEDTKSQRCTEIVSVFLREHRATVV